MKSFLIFIIYQIYNNHRREIFLFEFLMFKNALLSLSLLIFYKKFGSLPNQFRKESRPVENQGTYVIRTTISNNKRKNGMIVL